MSSSLPAPLSDQVGRCVVVQVLGDAEAWVFDFDALPHTQQGDLVKHHLRAFDERMQREGKGDWAVRIKPFALLGHSMPREVLGRYDLSAPHEGILLLHAESGGVVYCAARDDERLAIAYPDVEAMEVRETHDPTPFDPSTAPFGYAVDRTPCEEFTLGELAMVMSLGGAELTFV